jgi:hypothetical protein
MSYLRHFVTENTNSSMLAFKDTAPECQPLWAEYSKLLKPIDGIPEIN